MNKQWGKKEFWGLGPMWDLDFLLTEEQKVLRDKLIELCRTKIRPHAVECDKTYEYPRKSLNALSELGLLGLIIPKSLGGLGENHIGTVMVVETLARYGCPSTAMVYVMHLTGLAMLLLRHHDNDHIKDLLRRVNKDKLIGTSVHSDPSTGGHFWFPLSSKSKMINDDMIRVLKSGSWATSAGHADWYAIETVSPKFSGNFSDLTVFLVYRDEIRANTDDWSSLGLHGNQSGPLLVDANIPLERIVGSIGEGVDNNNEAAGIEFFMGTSAVWNGIALGCIDLGKKHVTRKSHADMGIRICDYPIIQDYFGDSICTTNGCRSMVYLMAQQLDNMTKNRDWDIYKDPKCFPRTKLGFWFWQSKHNAAENVNYVSDKMLKACGGTGYKTDLGLERLLRDGRAGCVMAVSNEVIRSFLGKASLLGLEHLDLWQERCDQRALQHEVEKMTLEEKKTFAEKLKRDIEVAELPAPTEQKYDDFDNPFNVESVTTVGTVTDKDGASHPSGLSPDEYRPLTLASRTDVSENSTSFVFKFPDPLCHSGCLPGQYVEVKCSHKGKDHERYFSPVSTPSSAGTLQIVIRFESHGIVSEYFKQLKEGDVVQFRGPCGGFEYTPNTLDELTILVSGGGVTPGLQLIRGIGKDPADKTKANLLYFVEKAEDILFREELNQLNGDPRIKVVTTVGEPPEEWEGEEGFIDTDMIKQHVTEPEGIKQKVIICGGPTMVISCLYSLKTLGYPSESIFIFGPFGAELIRSVFGRNTALGSPKSEV